MAAVAAVQLTQKAEDPIVDAFHHVDRNDDGEINRKELVRGLREFAKENNHKITRKDRRFVRRAARKADKDNSRSLDLPEFRHFVDMFMKHYGIPKPEESDDEEEEEDQIGQLKQIFDHVDTSDDGLIDEGELVTALVAFAKSKGHKITQADKDFVEKTAEKADANDDDHLNFEEFVHFAKAFAKHYNL